VVDRHGFLLGVTAQRFGVQPHNFFAAVPKSPSSLSANVNETLTRQ
jgi:hypothetical protein